MTRQGMVMCAWNYHEANFEHQIANVGVFLQIGRRVIRFNRCNPFTRYSYSKYQKRIERANTTILKFVFQQNVSCPSKLKQTGCLFRTVVLRRSHSLSDGAFFHKKYQIMIESLAKQRVLFGKARAEDHYHEQDCFLFTHHKKWIACSPTNIDGQSIGL